MTPEIAYRKLLRAPCLNAREYLEHTISVRAEYSCLYAEHVIGGRFELGEAAISKDALYSYFYARDVIGGRFHLGEAVICKYAWESYHYAKNVIGGRFELGEAAISQDAEWSYCYAKDVIQGRLPDIMHRKMIAFGIIDSSDKYVKKYLGSKKYCTLKRKDTKNESKLGI